MLRALGVVAAAAALLCCKKEGPCGRDDTVDTRPLPPEWAARWAMPDGTTACMMKSGEEYGHIQRHYVVPTDSTSKAVDAWERAFTAKGWKKQPPTKAALDRALRGDNCLHGAGYLHDDGFYLGVSVSSCAEGSPGWSTVVFRAATDADRRRP